jgi:UDPglucose--hexose-1-phosphate uridylyltransferase
MERFGPLALRRMVKDDGRALLVYAGARDGDTAAGDDGAEAAQDAAPAGPGAAVSQLRHDALRDEQVVYAIHRQDRTFLPARDHCPLDPTRPGGPVTEIPLPSFEIAVFDNRFPAFEPPHGTAEVVVYTDDHDAAFATLPAQRAEELMWVWRQRYLELGARGDVDYVYIFENRGVEVGVTLHHPHGQIYAYPFLPPIPSKELAADARLGGCAVCALLAGELEQRERVVHESEHVVAFVPYAARWAYEAHVALRAHRASLLDCGADELRELAAALQALARGYDALFDRPFPYVMAVHQAPTRGRDGDTGHLHVEVYPPLRTADKLKYLAGSEQGAGTFISDTLPEESARALAEAIADAG